MDQKRQELNAKIAAKMAVQKKTAAKPAAKPATKPAIEPAVKQTDKNSRNTRRVWQCTKSPFALRLVTSDAADRLPPDLSSTKLRAVIASNMNHQGVTMKELEDALRPLAISPGILAEYIIRDAEKEKEKRHGDTWPRKRSRYN